MINLKTIQRLLDRHNELWPKHRLILHVWNPGDRTGKRYTFNVVADGLKQTNTFIGREAIAFIEGYEMALNAVKNS